MSDGSPKGASEENTSSAEVDSEKTAEQLDTQVPTGKSDSDVRRTATTSVITGEDMTPMGSLSVKGNKKTVNVPTSSSADNLKSDAGPNSAPTDEPIGDRSSQVPEVSGTLAKSKHGEPSTTQIREDSRLDAHLDMAALRHLGAEFVTYGCLFVFLLI